MILFILGSLVIILMLIFESAITSIAESIARCCSKLGKKKVDFEDEEDENQKTLSDDVFHELSFDQLFHEYVKLKQVRQRYRLLRSNGEFTETQLRKHVEKHLAIIERNEQSLYHRLMQLTVDHIDRIEGIDADEREFLMTKEAQMKTVCEYYKQAIDKDNPIRATLSIDDSMHGRMGAGNIQSYDLMDNPRYKELDQLLIVMKETFGYNEDIAGLVKQSLTEANFMLNKKSMDLKRLITAVKQQGDKDAVKSAIELGDIAQLEDSMKSNDNLIQRHETADIKSFLKLQQ